MFTDSVAMYVRNRSMQKSDPVFDFLFEYYRFSPAKLMACLRNPDALPQHPESFPNSRKGGLEWVIRLNSEIQAKPPVIGCDGLHEWAMVYKQEQVRHPHFPLRLPRAEMESFIESSPIRCSHFDAFRFFTEAARPMNKLQPDSESRFQFEQPGCLHANMDVYKWAYTFHPWVTNRIVIDSFELAHDIRILDMQASPYDVSSIGLEAVAIETGQGRAAYRERQADFARRAKHLRARLLTELGNLHSRRFENELEQVGILDKTADRLASGS